MCGIFGCIDFNGSKIDRNLLNSVSAVLSHRGPDDEGCFLQEDGISCALLHRRLGVIGVSAGRQPIVNEKKTIALICNGEIYNYQELRDKLTAMGHSFVTESDSETIVHAYEEFSFDCLEYLRGMYAFAIWDMNNRLLFLARDRVGKKPLYYYRIGDSKLVFASEIRALLAYKEIIPRVNRRAVKQFLSYCYVPAPETALENIYNLEPAHYIVFSSGCLHKKKYWDVNYNHKVDLNEKKASLELKRLLYESVRMRMMSDVPVGVFLSGGLDSSIVTHIASRESVNPLEIFSIGFQEERFNELPYARISAEYCNKRNHNEIIMRPEAFKLLPELIELFGQPHADSSALATMLLAQYAKKKITVALTGEGSDELFGGYRRHLMFSYARRLRDMRLITTDVLRLRFKHWLGGINSLLQQKLLIPDFLVTDDQSDAELFSLMREAEQFSDIDSALYIDTKFFLPYDLLAKLDVSTMAYAVEARAPFLDHKLIEFVASLPSKIKLRGLTTKSLLRKTFKDDLPKGIIRRKKTGFVVPVQDWFRKELKNEARDILLSHSLRKRGYFNMQAVARLLEDHFNSRGNFGQEIWSLITLELWHRKFIDEKI